MKISKKEEYLKNKDKKLMRIIELNGHIKFKPNKDNQFNILAEIVISQFISTLAANSIISKIKKYFNTDHLKEEHFQGLKIEDIKNLGLSHNKARSLKELSELFINKQFQNLADLDSLELHKKLQAVFGIGPWTINMFEIFCIGNLNVFSSKDAGLRKAMNISGMVEINSEWESYDKYADRWSPYKTIASLHLWKTVD